MSGHSHSEEGNYEKRDVKLRIIVYSLVGLTFLIALGIGISVACFRGLESWMKKGDKPLSPVMQTKVVPPEPRLQVYPAADLETFQKEQQESLSGYAWIDPQAGIARIPIERAMEILAKNQPGSVAAKPKQEQGGAHA